MIETKEQHNAILRSQETEGHFDSRVASTLETIEALRDVARAGRASEEMFDVMAIDGIKEWLSYPMQQMYATNHTGLRLALNALPDWITENA